MSRLLPPVVWMALIFVMSGLERPPSTEDLPGKDKTAHVAVYAVLGALWVPALPGRPVARAAWAALIAALYGVSDEWHQSFVPGRSADRWDVAADAAGAVLGAALAGAWLARRAR